MSSIDFCKFHGFGNDYIVFEADAFSTDEQLSNLAKKMCNRHEGVGSDGIAPIRKLDGDKADFFCEIINPDGSFASFSGNGTRCAAAYLFYKELVREPALRLETRSGVKLYHLTERLSDGHYWFEAEVGKPKFASDEVPVLTEQYMESVIERRLPIDAGDVLISAVNVGNPVACTFVDEFPDNWRRARKSDRKSSGVSGADKCRIRESIDRENIEVRIWERGAGETSASGTCSAGAAILSAFTGKTDRNVSVIAPGGTTEVYWRKDDEMPLTGRTDLRLLRSLACCLIEEGGII